MTPPEIEDIDAITDLVKGGKDIKQIMAVLQALDAINENDKRKKLIEEQGNANRMFLDKEFVLGKDNVYIYRDNRTKKKGSFCVFLNTQETSKKSCVRGAVQQSCGAARAKHCMG